MLTSQPSSQRGILANTLGWSTLLTLIILGLAWLAGFMSRLFAVIRFESIIHEFDPWFNYRATHYMSKHGFYNFLNWFDDRAWYPLGRIVGGTVYPGLMVTSGMIHWLLNLLNIPIHIREVCVFLAPFFSGLTAIAMYLFTRELWSSGAGLFAACFIAIVPGYISRSVAGSYDNEGIAIFALMFTYFLWIKSVKTGSIVWSSFCALSYFYMVSAWGGYVFIINLIPLHVFVLLLMQRFSERLYIAYSVFYIVGLLLSMQVPFVGFQPVRTSEHTAAMGTFLLMQAYAFLRFLQAGTARLTRKQLHTLFFATIVMVAAAVFAGVVLLTYMGFIAPWSGRFYSLWDTGYAKIHIPIIASVSEHQPTTWTSFFFDLHILVALFPAGVWLCIRELNDERVFVILYAISASYFAGVMVRLILTLTPVVCVLSAIALSRIFEIYLRDETPPPKEAEKEKDATKDQEAEKESEKEHSDERATSDGNGSVEGQAVKRKKDKRERERDEKGHEKKSKRKDKDKDKDKSEEEDAFGSNLRMLVVLLLVMMLLMLAVHCTWVTSNAYSSPSVVLANYHQDGTRTILDDFREAYYWLWQNTHPDARVMSWWDYGYQIAGMGNRTTLVDNNTWNNSHIALVGKAMSSNETEAYKIMRALDVDYVLVIFGGLIGYSGDDINKFLWMVRIAEGEHPRDIHEPDYFTPSGEYRVDSQASQTMLNCLMYKMSYYRFGELLLDPRMPTGYDRTRGAEIGRKNFDLSVLREEFTSEHWLVRIYSVKQPPNHIRYRKMQKRIRPPTTRKNSRNLSGSLKNAPNVVKGRRASN